MLTPSIDHTPTARARQLGLLSEGFLRAKDYTPSPPPPTPSWKLGPPAAVPPTTVETLQERAVELREKAANCSGTKTPSLSVQLGQILLGIGEAQLDVEMRSWDSKGKGECASIKF